MPTTPNLLLSPPRYHKRGVLFHRMKLISFSCTNQRRPGQTLSSSHHPWPTRGWLCIHNELFLAHFGAQERREFLSQWWDDECNGKSCFFQSELLEAKGSCCRRTTVRISWFWPRHTLPLLFLGGKFGKSQFPSVPGLPQDMLAGRVARGGERHGSSLLRQHHLNEACLKNS